MKRILTTAIGMLMALTAFGQRNQGSPHELRPHDEPSIEDVVKNLSESQISQLETITSAHKKRVSQCRRELEALRDSIRMEMEKDGDQSAVLFPMYEREGKLMSDLSKMYYMGGVEVEKVLTPKQKKQLKRSMKEDRKQEPRPPRRPGERPPKDKNVRK